MLDRLRAARRRRSPSATTRPTCRADVDFVADLDRHPRPTTPRSSPPASAGVPVAAPGRDARRHRRHPPDASRWPAPTARPRPRRCSPSCSSRPGLQPVVHHRRRRQRDRQRRGLGRRRAGSWSRPTRATARSSSCPAHAAVVTNVEADHLEYYGGFEALRGGLRPVPRRTHRAPAWCAPTTRVAAALGRGRRRRHLRHRRRRRLPHGRPRRAAAAASTLRRCGTTASALGDGARCPSPGLHNARNATAALATGAASSASPFEAGARRAGPLRRRGPPLRAPGRGRRRHVRRRLRPPARPRSPACCRPPARAGWGRVVVRVPAPPLQPHRGAVARLRRRLRRRRPARRHRRLRRRARRRGPGVTGKLVVQTPCSTPTRGAGVAYLPDAGPTSSAYLRRRAAPRRPLPHPRRRRPHRRCPTSCRPLLAPAGRRRVTDAARRRLARSLGRTGPDATCRSARSPPTGSAARPRCSCEPTTTPTSAAVAAAVAADRACRCSWSGKGRTCWSPTPGFAGLAVRARRRASPTIDDRRRPRSRAGGAASLPVVARRTAAAGLTGFEWAVGVPGSIGGAVRMNAGGHGSDMAAALVEGPRRRPAQRGGWTGDRRPTSTSATAARRSRPSQVVLAAELRLAPRRPRPRPRPRSPRSCGGGARTSPAAPNAGSVFTNPPGDSAGRLIDAAGLQGPAASAPPRCRPSTPTSSRPTTGGSADDVVRPDGRGPAPGRTSHTGVDLAARDPPGRLRAGRRPRSDVEGS